jgi:hypothetical protein
MEQNLAESTPPTDSQLRRQAGLIESLYCNLLGRTSSDPAEVAHWVSQIQAGQSIEEVVQIFLECDEFKGQRSQSLFVPPGHFYSPIVNVAEINARYSTIFNRDLAPAGIDIRESEQIAYANKMATHYGRFDFPDHQSSGQRYFYENPAFSYADAITLACTILEFQPRRLLEVGSGYSSAATLDIVERELGWNTHCTFIEPYGDLLRSLMKPGDAERVTLIEKPVQEVDLSVFETLQKNDILFIDSTHVVKTGSDVVYHFTKALPRLRSGVIIHIHDMFYPFEYSPQWVLVENRSWNELYLVQAFLMGNRDYEILFFNDFMASQHPALMSELLPKSTRNGGGSLWLRKL